MNNSKNLPIRKLRKPAEIAELDPDLNPYSTEIFEHQDIIWFEGVASAKGFEEFIQKPLVVDLGCGSGNFLRGYAAQFPAMSCIGVELRFKRLVKAAKKYKKSGLTNVRLIRSMAEELSDWFKPGTVDLIHINFPDPWAKKKQRKHRLVQPLVLDDIHQALKVGGRFVFKTDHQEYYHSSLEWLKLDERFNLNHESEDLHSTDIFNIYTEFEELFKSKGMPVYYVELEKK